MAVGQAPHFWFEEAIRSLVSMLSSQSVRVRRVYCDAMGLRIANNTIEAHGPSHTLRMNTVYLYDDRRTSPSQCTTQQRWRRLAASVLRFFVAQSTPKVVQYFVFCGAEGFVFLDAKFAPGETGGMFTGFACADAKSAVCRWLEFVGG